MSPRYDHHTNAPYRSRRGLIFGVCRGLAEHFNFSVFWTRVLVFAAFVFTGFWPVGALYFVLALLMRPEPVVAFRTEGEAEFYNSYTASRKMALHRLKRTYEELDRRIQRMEDRVTDRSYDWERRLYEGR
ncbi:MAG: PspC domain-containing protein [Candidatus Hydrogenedentota bacterium]